MHPAAHAPKRQHTPYRNSLLHIPASQPFVQQTPMSSELSQLCSPHGVRSQASSLTSFPMHFRSSIQILPSLPPKPYTPLMEPLQPTARHTTFVVAARSSSLASSQIAPHSFWCLTSTLPSSSSKSVIAQSVRRMVGHPGFRDSLVSLSHALKSKTGWHFR